MVEQAAILLNIATVLLSGGFSYAVASHQVEKEAAAQRQREIKDWYRRSSTLAGKAHTEWYRVMNAGEVPYEIVAHEEFSNRQETLEEHAEKGRTRNVDEGIVDAIDQAAAELGVAATIGPDEPGRGSEYADIERRIIPTLEAIQDESQSHIDTLADS